MAEIRCPHCGSPVMIRGTRWECGWCGDSGMISCLHRSEAAKLLRSRDKVPRAELSIRVTDNTRLDQKERRPDRAALEDMVRRWDFSEDEWACRDLLIAAFPEAAGRWTAEELAGMDTADFVEKTGEDDPETAVQMMKRLLDTAEGHLQEPEAAQQLLDRDLYGLCHIQHVQPVLLEQLKCDDRLAHQLFQSAYVGDLQEELVDACTWFGEPDLREKLLSLLERNPFPHAPIEPRSD